ncbi:uncharacterized protein IL334_003066 [Kwoniella shivajii]|uniref:Fork-head domain-containing protein n=1 Tax=Kwoniella shivajii TaxID=564305 RepID=A0ABZ1CWH2_9TREE|nr:hypothetical protein IL334_003066 [Kwoniella shivajii]
MSPDTIPPLLDMSTDSTKLDITQMAWEGEEELFNDVEDDQAPLTEESNIDSRPSKKPRKSKRSTMSTPIRETEQPSPISTSATSRRIISTSMHNMTSRSTFKHVDKDLINPSKPRIKTSNVFCKKQPPIPRSIREGEKEKENKNQFSDLELGLRPLTCPFPDDRVVVALGILSNISSLNIPPNSTPIPGSDGDVVPISFNYTRSDLIKYRIRNDQSLEPDSKLTSAVTHDSSYDVNRSESVSIAQGSWIKWEESGCLIKGSSALLPYSHDINGSVYKPDMTHVQAIRSVIAASPRGMLTLSQIYQAFEERWPWHETAGTTWKNSIRHNLSLNGCFVNIDKSISDAHRGGGKGGYWTVTNAASGKTARKSKKSLDINMPIMSKSISEEMELYPNSNLNPNHNVYSTSPSHLHQINDVYLPQSLTSLSARIRNQDRIHQKNPNSNFELNDHERIAKPKSAISFTYKVPFKPVGWIPKEIIQSSREIGISRPISDTPLDNPSFPTSPDVSSTVACTSTPSIPPQAHATNSSIPPSLFQSPPVYSSSSSSMINKQIHQVFTTRAGIPSLPTVEPKSNTRNAGIGTVTGDGGHNTIVSLPSLIKAIYRPLAEEHDQLGGIQLPPVNWNQ